MRKIWLVVLLLLPGMLRAQSNSAAGNLTAQGASCIATNCVSLRYQPNTIYATITLSGTWSATVQFEVSGDYGVTWVAAPGTTSSTSNGTTQFTVGGYTMMRARVSSFVSGTVSVTIIGSTQSVVNVGGGGGGGSTFSGGSVIDATAAPYNVVTGFIATDCTFTISQPTVVCTTTVPTSAMVGWIVKATNGCCGNANHLTGVHEFASGTTITGINAGTKTFTLSSNAIASVSPGATNGSLFGAGPDMTTNLASAYTAAVAGVNCKTLQLPAGPVFIKKGQFNGPATCIFPISGSGDLQHSIFGWGAYTSLLVLAEGFDFTTGVGNSCNGGPAFGSYACFGGSQATRMQNWGITALSDSAVGGASSIYMFLMSNDSQMLEMACLGVGANNSNVIGVIQSTGAQNILGSQFDGCGGTGLEEADTSPAVIASSFVGNDGVTALTVLNSSQVYSTQTGYYVPGTTGVVACTIAGTFFSDEDNCTTIGANGTSVNVTAGGIGYFRGDLISSSGATSTGLAVQNTGKASISQTTINGVTNAIVIAGTGRVTDDCANVVTAGAVAGLLGSCSATGVSLATGGVGLTSGWGTSTVASVATGSDSHRGSITITGAAGSASPTLTLTFPKAYLVAPASCTLSFGSVGATTDFTNSFAAAPSTSSVVFTLIGTPTAVTIVLNYQCGP